MAEPSVRVAVTVTFLRMDHPPLAPPLPLPADAARGARGAAAGRVLPLSLHTVGEAYVWWLRRTLPTRRWHRCCAIPAVAIHVLYRDGEPAGFFELDGRAAPDMNLGYFGLMPHAVGTGHGLGVPACRRR